MKRSGLLLIMSLLLANMHSEAATATVEQGANASNSPVSAKAQRGWGDGRSIDRWGEAPRNLQFIIGGIEAKEDGYPFTVAIAYRNVEGTLTQYCGGTLIGPKTVLTAAHCRVTVGDSVIIDRHDLSSQRGQERFIVGVTIPPNFNSGTFQNDIAILRLHKSVDGANSPGRYVTLAREEDPLPEGTIVTALGWGQTTAGGNTSLVLREVSLPVANQQQCAKQYTTRYEIVNSMACSRAPGKDTCAGDSGGPLLVTSPEGKLIQVGITSFGIRCAEPNYPGVYTRVASFSRWISDNLQ